jgi:hypothetical protein
MLVPVSTWRGDPREYAGCYWKGFRHLVAWVCIGRGIPHAKVTKVHHGFVIPKNKCFKKQTLGMKEATMFKKSAVRAIF